MYALREWHVCRVNRTISVTISVWLSILSRDPAAGSVEAHRLSGLSRVATLNFAFPEFIEMAFPEFVERP